jgi:acetolactate synthase-1/2/3 large subunit
MTGGEILIESLKAQGIRCIVGMPGNQNIHIYDPLLRVPGIAHYLIRNEQSATLVANGYARASGQVGCALTVPGPGSTNAATGLGDALTDSVPVLLITGGTEVAYDGRDRSKCFHGLDQATFFSSIARFFARPQSIAEIPAAVTGAFQALRAARPGPAVIELPSDIAAAEGQAAIPAMIAGEHPVPDDDALVEAAQILRSCKRPILLAGNNVIAADATAELRAVAEALHIPVILTRLGNGAFADGHALCMGHCRGKLGDALLQEADGLLSIGCRFTQIDTSNWTLSLPTPHVQFDPDPAEIGREFPVDLGVVGDLKQSLARFAEILRATNPPQNQWGDLPGRYRQEIAAARRPLPIMAAMRQLLPAEAIFSVDVTSVAYRAFDEFPVYRPRTFLYPCHNVTLGFGVPAAIGAKLAHPERPVVAFCGDGGFQMTACELATAAEHNIAVVWVVINDGSLSAIRGAQAKTFDGRVIDTDMQTPHLADLACAMGVRGLRLEPDQFPAAFAAAVASQTPTVIEVMMQDQRDDLIRQVPWLYPD